jgi:hypothetical protein
MGINSFDTSAAMALVDLSCAKPSERWDPLYSLPSPPHSDHDPPPKASRKGFAGKRLPGPSNENDSYSKPAAEDMQLKIGKRFLDLSETAKMNRLVGLRMLTSIASPALLPWNVMCLPNQRSCTINVEVDRCAHSNFAIPSSAMIPSPSDTFCRIKKPVAQVPIDFFDNFPKNVGVFEYLPKLISHAPYLRYLALQVTRKVGSSCLRDGGRSYDALIRDITSPFIEALIIDTADVDHAAVRTCPHDFFEYIAPLTSLAGFPCLRRVVAPQEAFISVDSRLYDSQGVKGIWPTLLLPPTIEKVEIIDSTTALDS